MTTHYTDPHDPTRTIATATVTHREFGDLPCRGGALPPPPADEQVGAAPRHMHGGKVVVQNTYSGMNTAGRITRLPIFRVFHPASNNECFKSLLSAIGHIQRLNDHILWQAQRKGASK